MTLVNLYAPNHQQKHFYSSLVHRISLHGFNRVILCGDFNEMDSTKNSTSTHRKRSNTLSSFLFWQDLFDAWRSLNDSERDYSFYSNSQRSYSRIDLFLVDKYTFQSISKAQIGSITWSDHAPDSIELQSKARPTLPFCLESELLTAWHMQGRGCIWDQVLFSTKIKVLHTMMLCYGMLTSHSLGDFL